MFNFEKKNGELLKENNTLRSVHEINQDLSTILVDRSKNFTGGQPNNMANNAGAANHL